MANQKRLAVLHHQSALYSLEAQAALGHRAVQAMLPRFLREYPSHLLPRADQKHQANQGLLLNLCCQELPSLHVGQENLD